MSSNRSRTVVVTGKDGLRGTVADPSLLERGPGRVMVELAGGQRVSVPTDILEPRDDGSYYMPVSLREIEQSPLMEAEAHQGSVLVVPIAEEQLTVGRRRVETGGVRIRKQVSERQEVVEEPGFVEEVSVERVPINRPVDGPSSIRREGDTVVVPLYEEALVVSKQLVLKEELRITKRRTQVREPQRVTLRSEEALVEPLGGESGH